MRDKEVHQIQTDYFPHPRKITHLPHTINTNIFFSNKEPVRDKRVLKLLVLKSCRRLRSSMDNSPSLLIHEQQIRAGEHILFPSTKPKRTNGYIPSKSGC